MTAVVIDTHVLIWYIFDLNRLSEAALKTLEQAVNTNSPIYISAISIIEIAYLIEKGRIATEVLTRVLSSIDNPSINIFLVPIDRHLAVSIQQIDRIVVPEMPDRIIATTALYLQLPLVTRDLRIQALSNIKAIW